MPRTHRRRLASKRKAPKRKAPKRKRKRDVEKGAGFWSKVGKGALAAGGVGAAVLGAMYGGSAAKHARPAWTPKRNRKGRIVEPFPPGFFENF